MPRPGVPALMAPAVALALALPAALAAAATPVPPVPPAEPAIADEFWVRSVDPTLEVRTGPRSAAPVRGTVPGVQRAAELEDVVEGRDGWWARLRYPRGLRGYVPTGSLRSVPELELLPPSLEEELDDIATRGGRSSAIEVRDAFGRTLFSEGTTRPLVLASVTKVFTVAAGLRYVPEAVSARGILGPSDNFRAQVLMNRLGGGANSQGTARARRYAAELGARARLADGSGLSPANRASAGEVADLLVALREQTYFRRLRDGLPVAGRSGTLGGRMVGTAAAGRVRAKTGTLFTPAVSTLAGYVVPKGTAGGPNRMLTFAVLHNGVSHGTARALQDRVAILLTTRTADEE